MFTWKSLIVIFCEALCSFLLVFSLAFFWGGYKSKDLSGSSSPSELTVAGKAGYQGLRYNPARRWAQVIDDVALVFQRPSEDSEIIDEIPYGSKIVINGWDSSRKFINVVLPQGIDGFVSVQSLSYENSVHPTTLAKRQLDKTEIYRQQLLKYFRLEDSASLHMKIAIDNPRNGFEASKSLTSFVNTIQKNMSESSFDFEKADFALLVWDENGAGRLAYPPVPNFMTMIRRNGVGIRLSASEGSYSGESLTSFAASATNNINVSLTQELPVSIVSTEFGKKLSALKSLSMSCYGLSCQLNVVQKPDAFGSSLGAVFLNVANYPKATLKIAEDDGAAPYSTGFLNFDGDGHDDLAIFFNKSPSKHPTVDVTYVALNDRGLWRLIYVRDYASNGMDAIGWTPEPGQYDGAVAVRIYSKIGQPIAYTLDGSDPSCQLTAQPVIFSETEVLVDKSMGIKAKICGPLAQPESVVLANYEILPKESK